MVITLPDDPAVIPPGPPVRCDFCGLFTRRAEARVYPDEIGDYGQIYSWVIKCAREKCKE